MRVKTNDKYISVLLKNTYENVSNEIILGAKLNRLYENKVSNEIVNEKVKHQLNAMDASIHQINPKFSERSKNYEKVREEIVEILKQYEDVLKRLADKYDAEIEKLIYKKVELESKLLMAIITKEYLYNKEITKQNKKSIVNELNTMVDKIKSKVVKKEQLDERSINRLKAGTDIEQELQDELEKSEEYKENQKFILNIEKEIKVINKKIRILNKEKKNKLWEAMESGGKALTVEVRKPRKLKNITKFFSFRFNTYKVITKNVMEPINQKIDEFKVNDLKQVNGKAKELDLLETEKKIVSIKETVFGNLDNKIVCKEMGIF